METAPAGQAQKVRHDARNGRQAAGAATLALFQRAFLADLTHAGQDPAPAANPITSASRAAEFSAV